MSNAQERESHKYQVNNSGVLSSMDALTLAPRSPQRAHNVETLVGQQNTFTHDQQPEPQNQPYEHHQQTSLEPEHEEHNYYEDEESITMMEPNPSWKFNNFLVDLAEKISPEELEKIKHLFIDEIGESVLCQIKTASDLFKIMRQRLRLDRNNVLFLQAILLKLKRPQLIRMAIDYSITSGNVLYFSPASEEPVNGYRHVKFHVEGDDFSKKTKNFVNTLRQTVSSYLCVPPQNVLIAGVEPSSSMLITLLIPELYADIFEDLLKDKENLEGFVDIGIDTIAVGENVYSVYGLEGVELVETDEQAKLVNVFHQLQQKKKQLEEREAECLKFARQVDTLKSRLNDDSPLQVLKTMFYTVPMQDGTTPTGGKKPASLASQSSFIEFSKALKLVSSHEYDTKIIWKLLDANSWIITARLRESQSLQYQQLELAVRDLQSQVIPLKLELEKTKFYLQINPEGMERFIQEKLEELLRALPRPSIKVEITEAAMPMLKKISRGLYHRNIKKLEQKYKWDPNDQLTKAKNESRDLFLACIVLREATNFAQQGLELDCVSFVSKCLLEVERGDLNKKFLGMVTKLGNNQQQEQKQADQQKNRERQRHPSSSDPDINFTLLNEKVENIERKVTAIHEVIEATRTAYNDPLKQPQYEPFSLPRRTTVY